MSSKLARVTSNANGHVVPQVSPSFVYYRKDPLNGSICTSPTHGKLTNYTDIFVRNLHSSEMHEYLRPALVQCVDARPLGGRALLATVQELNHAAFTVQSSLLRKPSHIVEIIFWDILASRQAFAGTWDTQLKIGTDVWSPYLNVDYGH